MDKVIIDVSHRGDPGNPVTIVVRGPDNQVVGQEDCTSTGGKETSCSIEIPAPVPGDWKLDIDVSTPPLEVDHRIIVEVPNAGATFQASVGSAYGNEVSYPYSLIVLAQVWREFPITQVGLTVQAEGPDGTPLPTFAMTASPPMPSPTTASTPVT